MCFFYLSKNKAALNDFGGIEISLRELVSTRINDNSHF